MDIIDFSRSFLTFRVDFLKKPGTTQTHKPPFALNNARIQIDCHCAIQDTESGATQEFVLGASCKTERVGVEQDIFTEPNADFCPIFSKDRFLHLKTFDRARKGVLYYPPSRGVQPERQTGAVAEGFDSLRIEVSRRAGQRLDAAAQVVDATFAGAPLIGRTEIANGRYRAMLEYPVKTMNVSERDWIYQTDTGPVLFPDLSRPPEELIEGLELAYSAFNGPSWIEFIVRTATPVEGGFEVYHYSKKVRMDVKNELFRLD